MKNKKQIIIYSSLLVLGIIVFILEIFVFQKPDGLLGLIICLVSLDLIIGSIIKLCKLSKKFTNVILESLELIFWLP